MNVIFVNEVFHGINAFEVAYCIRSRKEKKIFAVNIIR